MSNELLQQVDRETRIDRTLNLVEKDAFRDGHFIIDKDFSFRTEFGVEYQNAEALHEIAKHFVSTDVMVEQFPETADLHDGYKLYVLEYRAYVKAELGIDIEHTEAIAILESEVLEIQMTIGQEVQEERAIEEAREAQDLANEEAARQAVLQTFEENKGE